MIMIITPYVLKHNLIYISYHSSSVLIQFIVNITAADYLAT